jgi:cellulase/cellobiase CelA1
MRMQRGIRTLFVCASVAGIGCSAGQQTSISESQSMLLNGKVGTVTATIAMQSDWPTGYCANVTIGNSGSTAISTWSVGIDLSQATMNQVWNATSTQNGTVLTFKPVSWNATIPAGGSVSFGYCATKTGTSFQPNLVAINGSPVGTVDGGAVDSYIAPDLPKPVDTACVPISCASVGATCGSISDNCGGVLNCGTCTAPETCGGGGTPNKCGAPSALSATLATQTDWPTGYCDNVTVKNSGTSSTTSWTVVIQLNKATENQIWNATGTTSGSQLTAKSLSWNATIPAGGSTSFGYCATKTGTPATPSIVSVTGTFIPVIVDAAVVDSAPIADAWIPVDTTKLDVAKLDVPKLDVAKLDVVGVDTSLPGDVTTSLAVQTTWETGYCMNATVTNGKATGISTWTVVINLNQSTFSQIWNGVQTVSGSTMTVKPVSFNAAIPAGGTASFGFCGTKTGTNFMPTVVSTTGS